MKLLFMCVANSARSQLAEGLAKKIFGPQMEIESAGSKPSRMNPFAAEALQEVGIDPSQQYSKSVDDLPAKFVSELDFVITLCAEEVCPVIISKAKKLHWPLPDPAGHAGSDAEQLARFRQTRALLQDHLEKFKRSLNG
jgi:arsenate reductase (thioredoxin)